jgi:release factor glutamine methyltransferase
MPFQDRIITFNNLKFILNDNVYEPAEDSFLFANNLSVSAGDKVLDMGTGCGILGILSAEKSQEVIGIDINPYAIYYAKRNAELNNVIDRVSFIQGDLFDPIAETETFDLIMFNAPYLPKKDYKPLSWIERAWAGGIDGRNIIDAFLEKIDKYLSKSGRLLLLQSNLSDIDKTIFYFNKKNLNTKIIADLKLAFFEKIVIIEASYG